MSKYVYRPKTYTLPTTQERNSADYKKSVKFQWQPSKTHQLYAFTVKIIHNGKNATEKAYEPFFNNLFAKTQVICYCAEISPLGVLHYHGAIKVKKHMYLKKLRTKGFHLYTKVCYNFKGWADYCFKNNIYYSYDYLKDVHHII